jgi:hypothetical protein
MGRVHGCKYGRQNHSYVHTEIEEIIEIDNVIKIDDKIPVPARIHYQQIQVAGGYVRIFAE